MFVKWNIVLLIFVGLFIGNFGVHVLAQPAPDDEGDLIFLTAESDTIEIGEEIKITGSILPEIVGSSPSSAVILISAPEGSLAETFVLANPDHHGLFHYSHPADVGGVWGFEALYTGYYSEKIEVTAVPSAEPRRTSLTLSGWPLYPTVGESVSFKGRLTDATGSGIGNRKLSYEVAISQTGCISGCGFEDMMEWHPFGSLKTDKKGEYFFILPVAEEGKILIKMVFTGDEQYSEAESRPITIRAST